MVALPIVAGLIKDDYVKLTKGDVNYTDSRNFVDKLCKCLNLCSWPRLVVIETAVYPISQILDLPGSDLEDIYLRMTAVGEVLSREVKASVITITRSGGFRDASKIIPEPQWPRHPGEGIFITTGILPISVMSKLNKLINWYGDVLDDLKDENMDELSGEFMSMYKLSHGSVVFLLPPIADVDAVELKNTLINNVTLIYSELEEQLRRHGVKVRRNRI